MGKCKAKVIQTNLGTFRHNQTYPGIIQAYSGILRADGFAASYCNNLLIPFFRPKNTFFVSTNKISTY